VVGMRKRTCIVDLMIADHLYVTLSKSEYHF
jgi:hypothetical protein